MSQHTLFGRLEKALLFLAGFTLFMMAFQGLGILIYRLTVWPQMTDKPSWGLTLLVIASVVAGFTRSVMWIRIYLTGAKLFQTLKATDAKLKTGQLLAAPIRRLTRLLVLSCILDVLTLPSIFFMDAFALFTPMASWILGLVQTAVLIFPQASGVAALVLAYLLSQYGQILKERGIMQKELELTI